MEPQNPKESTILTCTNEITSIIDDLERQVRAIDNALTGKDDVDYTVKEPDGLLSFMEVCDERLTMLSTTLDRLIVKVLGL